MCPLLLLTAAIFASASPCPAGDWPMWRSDAARSASSPGDLPEKLQLQWTRQLPLARPAWPASQTKLQFDISYEPVVLGRRMFVGSNVNDSVTAYDTRSGKSLWRFYADGPVRFAPAAAKGRVYVCSDDGHLYCLDAETGKSIWKVNGGPAVRPIIGNDRLVSSWPARGGVVMADGIAYFAASIWPSMGIFIHAVDAETGTVIWTNSETGAMFITHPHGANSFGSISPQGSLAVSDNHLIVPGGRTQPAVFDRTTGKLLHFNFGSKGGGGFAVMAAGNSFVVDRSLNRIDDGKQFSKFYAQVVSDGWLIGSNGGSGPIVCQTASGDIKEKTVRDRKGRMVKSLTFVPREQRSFTADGPSRVFLKAGSRLYAAGDRGRIAAYDYQAANSAKEKQKTAWAASVDGDVWNMLAADDRLFVVTRDARIFCFGADDAEPTVFDNKIEDLAGAADSTAADTVKTLREICGSNAGYAIALGIGPSPLIGELVRQTDMHVIAVDSDATQIEQLRRQMDAAGVYGVRVAARVGNPATYPFPPYIASLIISESASVKGTEAVKSLFKPLRPYGGIACLQMTAAEHSAFMVDVRKAALQKAEVSRHGRWTVLKRVGALPEAGVWTHQYGDASNSVVSADKRVKAPLGVLWFGGPSNDRVLPRHGHGPTPQVVGGRLFIEGADMLRCVDVYTGRVWWERELPGLGNFYDNTGHQPGAGEVGSNYVSLEDHVYVVYEHSILKLDATTGKTVQELTLKPNDDGSKPYWGFIATHSDLLIATTSPVRVDEIAGGSSRPAPALSGYKPLIKPNDDWHYMAGGDPDGGWAAANYKPESGWKTGRAGFGYGDGDDRTVLKEMAGKYTRVYVRHEFDGMQAKDAQKLALAVNFDDAFIAYLNGKEVVRAGVGAGSGAKASKIDSHEASKFETFDIAGFRSLLKPGRNVIALEGHNSGRRSSDFSLDPYLLIKAGSSTKSLAVVPKPKAAPPALPNLLKPSQYSSASRRLVVYNRHTGEPLWSRDAEFNFRHNCICVADGKLFCIDGMSTRKLDSLRRRGLDANRKAKLYALDAQTGKELWSTDEDVFGTFLNYSVAYGVLVQAGSAYRDRAKDEAGSGIVAYQGNSGKVLWKNLSLSHGGPCLLWRDKIITNGGGGFQLELLTGQSTGWKYSRMYGCNTANGSEHLLTFRSGAAAFYDLAGDSGTGNLGGFKSSCTSNLVVADGVLNAPDYTRTCSCAYQNQTSLAMIHMPEAELWTFGAAAIDAKRIEQIGINFGAPGDRRDENGTLWVDYPNVGGPSPNVNLTVDADEPRWFRQHTSFITGNGPNWVAASGGVGIQSVTLGLGKSEAPRRYTVRLHFSEPDDVKLGERVFSVSLQDKPVLVSVDIIKESGGRNRAVVKELTGVMVIDTLDVSLRAIRGRPPVLSGIEVVGAQE
jgi:outer membrane protein assembly factor BamB